MTTAGRYPVHEALAAHRDRHETAREFYDFLVEDKGFTLARYHVHGDGCVHVHEPRCALRDEDGLPNCGRAPGARDCGFGESSRLVPAGASPAELLAEFLGVDLNAFEAEKRAMLDELRAKASR